MLDVIKSVGRQGFPPPLAPRKNALMQDMKTTTAKTQRSTKTEKSVAQERSKAKSVAQSEVQPGASRAASQVEEKPGWCKGLTSERWF